MKRIFSVILMLCMLSTFCGSALATDAGFFASPTLSRYTAQLSKGTSKGKITVSYRVVASAPSRVTSIGVSSIKIYKSDGTYVTTISGTTSNGLVLKNTSTHTGTYTYSGVSGTSYYAHVTVFATAGGITSSGTVKTNTVTAP